MGGNKPWTVARRMTNTLVAVPVENSDGEQTLHSNPRRRYYAATVKTVGVSLAIVCILGALASVAGPHSIVTESIKKMEHQEYHQDRRLEEVTLEKPPECAGPGQDCSESSCCKVSGHTCWQTAPGKAVCNDFDCRSGLCTPRPHRTSLYCFAVHIANTGNTECALINEQCKQKQSIFACDAYDVFADEPQPCGVCTAMVQVPYEPSEFHFIKRKNGGTWVNTGLFYQVWLKIRDLGSFMAHDWTVKVDPDSVFLPARMKTYLTAKMNTGLATKMDSDNGVYLENCESVDSKFLSATEVISRNGVVRLTAGLEKCRDKLFSECAGCDGEDVFVQMCLDENHVDKVEAFDLTTDGNCPADRPAGEKFNRRWAPDCSRVTTPVSHPFKKPKDFEDCLKKMTKN